MTRWLLLLALLAGCAAPRPAPPPATRPAAVEREGQASWYGHPHHGRRTASGEIYDMHALTAVRALDATADGGFPVRLRVIAEP